MLIMFPLPDVLDKIKYSKDRGFRVLLGRKEEMITVALLRKQKNKTLYGIYEHSSVKVHTTQCEQLDNLTLQLEASHNAVIKTKDCKKDRG